MNRRALYVSITAAAMACSLAACNTAQPDTATPSSEVNEPTATISTTATGVDAAPQIASGEPTPPNPTAVTTTTQPAAPYGSGHGLCFDLNSRLAKDSMESLGVDSNGGQWQVDGASNHPLSGGCGLDWLKVDGSGFGDATYTSRVLLFQGGAFVGTVEPHEYSYTSIAGDTLESVTVRYRWLRSDDPFCCPQGGPTTVTASVSNGSIMRDGQFPPPVK
ncbi:MULTISPECIES: LppP/LprE family lipoprotein [Gordonia]|uniref:LppP/LprE family lipoprotein n=1 Tax=Gordonia TaxID=2053 RepID=UPI003016E543